MSDASTEYVQSVRAVRKQSSVNQWVNPGSPWNQTVGREYEVTSQMSELFEAHDKADHRDATRQIRVDSFGTAEKKVYLATTWDTAARMCLFVSSQEQIPSRRYPLCGAW